MIEVVVKDQIEEEILIEEVEVLIEEVVVEEVIEVEEEVDLEWDLEVVEEVIEVEVGIEEEMIMIIEEEKEEILEIMIEIGGIEIEEMIDIQEKDQTNDYINIKLSVNTKSKTVFLFKTIFFPINQYKFFSEILLIIK